MIRFFDEKLKRPEVPAEFVRLFDGLPVDEFDPIWAHGWAGTMKDNDSFQAAPYGHNFYPCNWLWKSLAICWDGRVATCCGDFGPAEVFGDLESEHPAGDLERAADGADPHLQRQGKLGELPLCQGCDAPWQPDGPRWKAVQRGLQRGWTHLQGRAVRVEATAGLEPLPARHRRPSNLRLPHRRGPPPARPLGSAGGVR